MTITKIALRFNLRECIFSKFPGGHAPDPLVLACKFFHTMTVHMPASSTSNDDKSGCAPPFQKSRSTPVHGYINVATI